MPIAGPYVVPVSKLASLTSPGGTSATSTATSSDRQTALKVPGNMLTRPGLILNPWSLRKTETGKEEAAAGEAYAREPQVPQEVVAKLGGATAGYALATGAGPRPRSAHLRPRLPPRAGGRALEPPAG